MAVLACDLSLIKIKSILNLQCIVSALSMQQPITFYEYPPQNKSIIEAHQ